MVWAANPWCSHESAVSLSSESAEAHQAHHVCSRQKVISSCQLDVERCRWFLKSMSITTININTCPGRLAYVGRVNRDGPAGIGLDLLEPSGGFLGPKPWSVREGRTTIVLLVIVM